MSVSVVRSIRTRTIAIAAAALLALSVVYATEAGAEAEKTYTLELSPGVAIEGATTSFTLTITNTSPSQSLGSVHVDVPTGFDVVGHDSVIALHDLGLAPGSAPFTYSFDATAACDPTFGYTWTSAAKQANDFNGDGNDFVLVGDSPTTQVACGLTFLVNPSDTQVDWNLTGIAFDFLDGTYDGPFVQVAAVDPSGGTASWFSGDVTVSLLGGDGSLGADDTTTVAMSGGIATFLDLDVEAGFDDTGYFLRASNSDLGSTDSTTFTVYDQVVDCTAAGSNCSAQGQSDTTTATVTGDENAETVIVAVNDAIDIACGGISFASDTVVFDVTGTDASKTIEVTYFGAAKPASKYDLCYGGEDPFVDANGELTTTTIDFDGTTLYVGLLPTCRPKPKPGDLPCVQSRTQDKKLGSVTLIALLPPGDPLVKIG
jgi:hypothetical protein